MTKPISYIETNIVYAAIWARHIHDSRKKGENMDESELELRHYLASSGLDSFILSGGIIDYPSLEKQL